MTGLTLLSLGELLQSVGGLFMIATYLPQILLLFKTKSAENQSKTFWLMLIISLSTFAFNGLLLFIYKGVISVLITQSLNLLLAIVVFVQVMVYSKTERRMKEK